MGGSYRAEILKLVRRPAMWILGAVFLVLAQVFGYLIHYVAYRSGGGAGSPQARPPHSSWRTSCRGGLSPTRWARSRCSPAPSR
jgi:hypothetical protein